MRIFFYLIVISVSLSNITQVYAQHTIARDWNEALLTAIRNDFARPTVHARNLFHISAAMYDAWALYHPPAEPYLIGKTIHGYTSNFDRSVNLVQDEEVVISYAVYRLIKHRFQFSPKSTATFLYLDNLMQQLGYDISITSMNYAMDGAPALGNYIANQYINYGLQDGSNELNAYKNQFYLPVNPPITPTVKGNPNIIDPNRWQELALGTFIDQSGNEIPGSKPPFLGAEWGIVAPFGLKMEDATIYQRDNFEYWVYHDPGPPPFHSLDGLGELDQYYKETFALVAVWGGHLDPTDGVMWDISPNTIGNIEELPTAWSQYADFHNLLLGGDPSKGYSVNPVTGLPYEQQIVPRGDYTRVLAEFWADGPDSETPPGHWFSILNYVNDHPLFKKRFKGSGVELDDLEWDVKAYFTLGGAMHDAAVTAWGIKGWYDYVRPISAIRWLAQNGQSSDAGRISYHPNGIPLIPDHIEIVESGDPLVGENQENIGKIKVYSWRAHQYIADPETDIAGCDWILAEDWWPYQRPTFVTPPFAGFISGHSTFSRTAAEVLTTLTGNPFFPGGMGEFPAPKNEFLVFENGPSVDVTLQWATYRDASDQCSLSRIWGGIHPPVDDIYGRLIGQHIAVDAFEFAEKHFNGRITGISNSIDSKIEIYPNPVKLGDDVRIESENAAVKSVRIINESGQILFKKEGRVEIISTDLLSTGLNILIVELETGISAHRIWIYE